MQDIYVVLSKFHEDESSIHCAFATPELANQYIVENGYEDTLYVLPLTYYTR